MRTSPGSCSQTLVPSTSAHAIDLSAWKSHTAYYYDFLRAALPPPTHMVGGPKRYLFSGARRPRGLTQADGLRGRLAVVRSMFHAAQTRVRWPKKTFGRKWRLECEPSSPCRPPESTSTTLSVKVAAVYCRGKRPRSSSNLASLSSINSLSGMRPKTRALHSDALPMFIIVGRVLGRLFGCDNHCRASNLTPNNHEHGRGVAMQRPCLERNPHIVL